MAILTYRNRKTKMTTQNTIAQTEVNVLYQLAHNIESGAYVSSLRVSEFLTHLKNTNAFVSDFDHVKAFDNFNWDGDITVV
jgi:hypothetical protein